jgi:hypothetical protein
MKSSSISRRLEKAIGAYQRKDFEDAFIQVFPAIDKTGKKRRPKAGVGERIKAWIADEEPIITGIAVSNVFKGLMVDDIGFPAALYKFGRTSIVHEGELDERLRITESPQLRIGYVWELPYTYIFGIIIALVLSEENKDEKLSESLHVNLFDTNYTISDLFGRRKQVEKIMCDLWNKPDLFD